MIGEKKRCKNPDCGKEFSVPPTAEHKTFCSAACRTEWHQKERREALQLLRKHTSISKEGA